VAQDLTQPRSSRLAQQSTVAHQDVDAHHGPTSRQNAPRDQPRRTMNSSLRIVKEGFFTALTWAALGCCFIVIVFFDPKFFIEIVRALGSAALE